MRWPLTAVALVCLSVSCVAGYRSTRDVEFLSVAAITFVAGALLAAVHEDDPDWRVARRMRRAARRFERGIERLERSR